MPASFVFAVEKGSVGDIEIAHKVGEIASRCFQEKVEMVVHQYVAMENYIIILLTLRKNLKELLSIMIACKKVFAFVAAMGDMIDCAWILNSKGSDHNFMMNG